jgi:class 3 adenylate cyclase
VPSLVRWQRPLARLATLGVAPTDSLEVRDRKVTLTLAALVVTLLATIWVATYLALGLPVSAAIPFLYQVVTVATLLALARSKDDTVLRWSQLLLMSLLPFLLQWSLGGYAASSAVSLWALVAALGALFVYGPDAAIPWFALFVGLSVVSGLVDPLIAPDAAPIPEDLRTAFFVLTILGVSLTAYLMLQYAVRARDAALASSERLLLDILPKPIAERLKREPGRIAEAYADVSVLFADIVDFTPFAERTPPERVVSVLDTVFSAFDVLAERHGLEKIKTIGDAYMVAGGLPEPRPDHASAVADMALEMHGALRTLCQQLGLDLSIRVGMASGPVIAGVIGRRKLSYDLWGDTVNTAARMETHGLPGRTQVTQATYERLREAYDLEARGEIEVKGKGRVPAYLLVGRRATQDATRDRLPSTAMSRNVPASTP